MLSAELEELWAAYLTAERSGVRVTALPLLERFVDGLLALSEQERYKWAEQTAAAVADAGADLPIRFPLFYRVLFPVLAAGVLRGEPGYARRLSYFDQLLLQVAPGILPEELSNPLVLLEEAVRIDPADVVARRRLVENRARYLDYTLHELPAGVLYGIDGATIRECDELLECLELFQRHVEALGEIAVYQVRIQECRYHYCAYRDYLQTPEPRDGYSAYLQRRTQQ